MVILVVNLMAFDSDQYGIINEDLDAVIDLPDGLLFNNICSGEALNPFVALFNSILYVEPSILVDAYAVSCF